jgi:hypothetical protein
MGNLSGAFKEDVIENIPYCRARGHGAGSAEERKKRRQMGRLRRDQIETKTKASQTKYGHCKMCRDDEEVGRNEGGDSVVLVEEQTGPSSGGERRRERGGDLQRLMRVDVTDKQR